MARERTQDPNIYGTDIWDIKIHYDEQGSCSGGEPVYVLWVTSNWGPEDSDGGLPFMYTGKTVVEAIKQCAKHIDEDLKTGRGLVG